MGVVDRVVTDHARQRMAERLGRDATTSEWLAVLAAILDRRASLAATLDYKFPLREIWLVTLGDLPFRVVWQPDQPALVTVLPPFDTRRAADRIRPLVSRDGCKYRRGKRRRSEVIENR